MPSRLAILLSGRGSNYQAIEEAIGRGELDAEIVAVISNRLEAPGLQWAADRGRATHAVDHRAAGSREAHETAVREILEAVQPDFICLAGYMRRLTAGFVSRWSGRIINVHPSLLPAFPGVDAQAQAIAYGVRVSGCTVHFVDEGVDTGPIIVQHAVDVSPHDDAATLAAKILPHEHAAYVEALRIVCSGAYRVDGRRVVAL